MGLPGRRTGLGILCGLFLLAQTSVLIQWGAMKLEKTKIELSAAQDAIERLKKAETYLRPRRGKEDTFVKCFFG